MAFSRINCKGKPRQQWNKAELGLTQLKLGLGFTSIDLNEQEILFPINNEVQWNYLSQANSVAGSYVLDVVFHITIVFYQNAKKKVLAAKVG